MLNPDFKEFLQSLNVNNVKYLIVGGYAVAFHGHPRYTKDLDIWVETSPDNADKIMQALQQFGFGDLDLESGDLLEPDRIIQLGYPPVRIDLITTVDGVVFKDCYASRVETEIEEVQVPFIDLQSLKRNKQATGRYQDLADLENLD